MLIPKDPLREAILRSSEVAEESPHLHRPRRRLESGQATALAAGAFFAGFGLARRSLAGLVLAAVGGSLAWRSWLACTHCGGLARRRAAQTPQEPMAAGVDEVDEASRESFPASDPPAFNLGP